MAKNIYSINNGTYRWLFFAEIFYTDFFALRRQRTSVADKRGNVFLIRSFLRLTSSVIDNIEMVTIALGFAWNMF